MTPNPILKVLSTLTRNRVRYLLMGGQACVFYGAAEFSRDTDIAVWAVPENLDRLAAAVRDLQAEVIAVPPFEVEYLLRGHAVHFRCRHPEATGMRLDVMSVMRGVAAFAELWERRTSVEVEPGTFIDVLALPDLVQAKKTQRDKDWPMLRRLVEADMIQHQAAPTPARIRFWLAECRSPQPLIQLAQGHPELTAEAARVRPLLSFAIGRDEDALAAALEAEEKRERAADRDYWAPLKTELEQLRQRARS